MMAHNHDHSTVLGLFLDLDVDDVYIIEHPPDCPTVYWKVNKEYYPPLGLLNAHVIDMRIMRTEDGRDVALIEIEEWAHYDDD